MNSLQNFYNQYHKKNTYYSEIITENNFTYFYTQQFLQKALQKLGKIKPVVLDYGCGVGTVSLYLSKYSKTVEGLDISTRAIELAEAARKSLSIKNVAFRVQDKLNYRNNTYDLIICSEVIEHIKDEDKLLRDFNHHLSKSGILLLSTPLYDNIFSGTSFYKQFDIQVGHLRRYTSNSLGKVLKRNGFTVIASKKFESPLRNLLFLTKLGYAIRLIRGPMIPLFHRIDEMLIHFLGASNIIILAQKVDRKGK